MCVFSALANRFADVFFLVDSGVPLKAFSTFKSDLIKLINQLDAGASSYRVGLAQFSQDTSVELRLDASQTKQELIAAVKRFRLRPHPGRCLLGAALEGAASRFFSSAAGGRAQQGTQQLLVVLSGRDPEDLVSRAARSVRAAGVTLVGLSAGASMESLERFAGTGFTFPSPKVTVLKDLIVTGKPVSDRGGEPRHLFC